MSEKIPDLNFTYVEEPDCYYNPEVGLIVLDSVDPFEGLCDFVDNYPFSSFSKIPFDVDLLKLHDEKEKKKSEEYIVDKESVVKEEGKDEGFEEWFELTIKDNHLTDHELEKARVKGKIEHAIGKDCILVLFPICMRLPESKGAKARLEKKQKDNKYLKVYERRKKKKTL